MLVIIRLPNLLDGWMREIIPFQSNHQTHDRHEHRLAPSNNLERSSQTPWRFQSERGIGFFVVVFDITSKRPIGIHLKSIDFRCATPDWTIYRRLRFM